MDATEDQPDDRNRADIVEDRGPARKSPRASLFLLTTLTSPTGEPLGKARIRNLSASGLMAECERPLERGMHVHVDLRGVGEVTGVIAWTADDDNRIGIHFDHAIDPQLARKPVGKSPAGTMVPDYLRPIPGRFSR